MESKIKIKTAVVTAIGSFSADIVIKNLKKNGIRVIGCDIYPREWIADSENVDQFYTVPYATERERYVARILEICRREQADALLVLTDAEVDVLNDFRGDFIDEEILLCLPSAKTLALCRDKRAFAAFLKERKTGSPIPTWELAGVETGALSYPVIVKPYNGRSSQGLLVISSEEELSVFRSRVRQEEFVVQPFLQGSIITVDVVRQAARNEMAVICRKELLRTKNGAGTSVMVFRSEGLEQLCREIAEALDINGCVNFEFIESGDGSFHILECNPRFSGGVEFSCMAGYDCVTNHLRCFKGEAIEPCLNITGMYIARKYEEYITGITDQDVSGRE